MSIPVTTKCWPAGTAYGVALSPAGSKNWHIATRPLFGGRSVLTGSRRVTNCAASMLVLCVITGYAGVFVTSTSVAAMAWTATGGGAVRTPRTRGAAPYGTTRLNDLNI